MPHLHTLLTMPSCDWIQLHYPIQFIIHSWYCRWHTNNGYALVAKITTCLLWLHTNSINYLLAPRGEQNHLLDITHRSSSRTFIHFAWWGGSWGKNRYTLARGNFMWEQHELPRRSGGRLNATRVRLPKQETPVRSSIRDVLCDYTS